MEDLQVKNMIRSAKGTIEQPGRNVGVKAGLNRAILDQGWGELQRQLSYKLQWRGGILVLVPPQYSSQKCSECGHTGADNRPSQAVFHCQVCGHAENADANAAKNVKGAGLALLACGDTVPSGRSVKQEVSSQIAA
jgi:putative transposase